MKKSDIVLGEYVVVFMDPDSYEVIKIYEDKQTKETLYNLDDNDGFILRGVKRSEFRKIPKRGW